MIISELLCESAESISYHVTSPGDISPEIMTGLAELISAGQEVTMSVVNRNLANAASIAYALDGDRPVGIVVLKNPVSSYREKVFYEADVPELERNYKLEIGYTYVIQEYRPRGVGINICRKMVNSISTPMYATTREENTTINKLLKFAGFKLTGSPWRSDRGNYNLLLWTKE